MGFHKYGFYTKNLEETIPITADLVGNESQPMAEKGYQYLCETLSAIGIEKKVRQHPKVFMGQRVFYGCLD